ncbi:MAG: glutamate-5-semialdehyde dehydrogenase [Cyanobacteriota/Melainabacteria group bacterium]
MTNEAVLDNAARARAAAGALASATIADRNKALLLMAEKIEAEEAALLEANKKDLEQAKTMLAEGAITDAALSRLKLDEAKIKSIADGIRQVAALQDPLGKVTLATELDQDLLLERITCPLGVLAVIFESRPDALPQIVSLAIKTGNAVLLKGGREAEHSNKLLFDLLQAALKTAGLPEESLALMTSREDVAAILKAEAYVDLIIPRGSNSLVRHIQENTRIPVLGHADGICHMYLHEDADCAMATDLVVDAKTQYPSACNALETLLIHESLLASHLPSIVAALLAKGVELRLDETSFAAINQNDSNIGKAVDEDWDTEYCDLILSIKAVSSLDEAIDHINRHGSGHTDCLVSADAEAFEQFFRRVNSAGVYHNVSTRFADGFRYGFGAEVGIATGKLHPRGPVGLEGIVTYKYKLTGKGQTVQEYSGSRQFSHRRLV